MLYEILNKFLDTLYVINRMKIFLNYEISVPKVSKKSSKIFRGKTESFIDTYNKTTIPPELDIFDELSSLNSVRIIL